MSPRPATEGGPGGGATAGRPTVIVDARMVGPRPVGIGTYVSMLARGLSARQDRDGTLPYRVLFLVGNAGLPSGTLGSFPVRAVKAPFLHPRELAELPGTIADIASATPARTVYHSPSFSSLFRCPVPWLVTVHDLIHLRFGNPAQKLYYRTLVRPFFRGAAVRMTVSGHSREELARWTGVAESEVEVVPGAVDPLLTEPPGPEVAEPVLNRLGLERDRFWFCLSSPKRHKNVDTLVRAYRAYRAACPPDAPPFELVLNVPGHGDAAGVRTVGTLTRLELRVLFAATAGFFFPSRVEGFGFPPLEAAVAGAPVVLSAIPSLREALQPFDPRELRWIEPSDERGWAGAFRSAAAGELPRPSPEGRARARERYSPLRLAGDLDRVYRRVLGIGPES